MLASFYSILDYQKSLVFVSLTIMLCRFLLISLMLSGFAFAENLTLALPDSLSQLVSKATAQTMALKYGDAMATAKTLRSHNEGAGCVLENIVRISIYDDLGDTAALFTAGKQLEKCKSEGMWDALRKFELGYVQSETGHSVSGALKTRSAAKMFEDSKDQEARAFYAIYAYYVDKSFSWVPFKSDHREEYLAVLDSASKKSTRFWPLFLTPLIWMHYDKEDFNTGLKLAERGLAKAPNHPVMLQIKADMLYRLKRYDEAADIYEKSAADYMKRKGASIRYWCSVLNLIRIYHDAGKKDKAAEQRAKLDDPKYRAIESWMPGSLMDDLKKRKLL
jgi:tetratricopeptide (TPR) repeat protein